MAGSLDHHVPEIYIGPAWSYPDCCEYCSPRYSFHYHSVFMGPALASSAVLLPLRVLILLRTDDEIGQAVAAYALPYVVGAYSKSRCGFSTFACSN